MVTRSVNLFRVMLAAAVFMAGTTPLYAGDDPQAAIQGNWLTEPKDGIIQIARNGDVYEGRIVGGNEPGKLDTNNPDTAKRSLTLRGQLIIHDMKYDGDGEWSSGTIYDPKSGSTYKCKLQLRTDGSLKVRGYIGFSLIGKTQIWTRYTGQSMDLPKS